MFDKKINHFAVLGAGAWGSAIAATLANKGAKVTLWARRAEIRDEINTAHTNHSYLGDVVLPDSLHATCALDETTTADALVLVTPAQHSRDYLKKIAALKFSGPLILCAKGVEEKTNALQSQIAQEETPHNPTAILTGPSFASEVAKGLPAALTLATTDPSLGETLAREMSSKYFRLYHTTDVVGAQIGGAVKNVLAIACGICMGQKLGENARAALVTRGLAEMARLGMAMGAQRETLMGLSGLGDLVLTCASLQSRNMSLGFALGEGKTLDQILSTRHNVAEGLYSAHACRALADHYHIDMPIVSAIDKIIHASHPIERMIDDLLSRPLRTEMV